MEYCFLSTGASAWHQPNDPTSKIIYEAEFHMRCYLLIGEENGRILKYSIDVASRDRLDCFFRTREPATARSHDRGQTFLFYFMWDGIFN